jgi:hypothetical protein
MRVPTQAKPFLKMLIAIAEHGGCSLTGCTEDENGLIRSAVADIQNSLGAELEPLLKKKGLSDDTKKWKHNDGDFKERELWKDYMVAYEKAMEHCPGWIIVPADNSWYKEYIVVKQVVETLRAMNMRYPGIKST